MNKFSTLLVLLFATLTLGGLPLEDAEAKRFGFGKSLGKQYSPSRMKQAQKPAAAKPQQNQGSNMAGNATKRPSGASRWLGPLAGLAAGGLLASLFFGDAFEGFQVMDFLLIAAVIFGGMMLFRAMRARAPQARSAGGPAFGGDFSPQQGSPGNDARFEEEAGAIGTTGGSGSKGIFDAPAWFDQGSFLQGAKTHFLRLQAAWDKGDMQDIAEYTTPELFAEIQTQRLQEGSTANFTDVTGLDAELAGLQHENDKLVASVRFLGQIRESETGQAQAFSELWHVVHAWESSDGDWLIAGIQQV